MSWRPERVRVGTVGRAHGLRGAFHISGACGWWDFAPGTTVLLDGEPRRVASTGGDAERPVVRLEGVDDREGAAALVGAALELPREAVPEPEEDTWFRFDLVGCEVRAGERVLGWVREVEDGVAHDILVLDDPAETRIPFVTEIVPAVDIAGRRLEVVDWVARPAEDG